MRMQAFHADARAADTTGRKRSNMAGRQRRIALGGIASVSSRQFGGVDRLACLANPAGRLETINSTSHCITDQPIQRRHRLAVVEQRRITDYDRVTPFIAHHHIERAFGWTAEQLLDPCPVCRGNNR